MPTHGIVAGEETFLASKTVYGLALGRIKNSENFFKKETRVQTQTISKVGISGTKGAD